MGENSKIEWCDHTFNPWRGCEHATLPDGTPHPGCDNCYAELMSKRNPGSLGVWGSDGVRVRGVDNYWKQPIRWNRAAKAAGQRHRVFCASLADIFEDWRGDIRDPMRRRLWVDSATGTNWHSESAVWSFANFRPARMDDLRRQLFTLIDCTPHLDWMLLTKRPQNVRRMWPDLICDSENWFFDPEEQRRRGLDKAGPWPGKLIRGNYPRKNVWIGTSVSDQKTWDTNVHLLYHHCRQLTPVLFVSAEPLLGGLKCHHDYDGAKVRNWFEGGINQVIVGVESNGQRIGRLGSFADEVSWMAAAAEIVRQCRDHHCAAFVKQVPINGRVSHNPEEWPEELRVRDFPRIGGFTDA